MTFLENRAKDEGDVKTINSFKKAILYKSSL